MSNELMVDMLSQKNMISTGIPKLDELLGGGIQKGFTVGISSIPGTNIEIIMKQIASTDKPVFITTNETKDEIISTMDEFSWNSGSIDFEDIARINLDQILKGENRRVSIQNHRSKKLIKELIQAGSQGTPELKRREDDYLAILSNILREKSARKIIINSLDFFLEQYNTEDVLRSLKAGKVNIFQEKGALFFTYTRGIHDLIVERQIELLADCVIELDVVKHGSSLERILSIKKMRNLTKKIGSARYDIDDNGFTLEEIDRIL
jgi:KaiC/GvpD/RAD55 family RecA-like ATPase